MSERQVERRLAAILAADVAGYSRLMGEDEEGTLAALRAVRRELGDPKLRSIAAASSRPPATASLSSSPASSTPCAVPSRCSGTMSVRNAATPRRAPIEFRMGINIGDIIIEDDDIFGDGVNIAARLEGLAEPGGICSLRAAHERCAASLDLAFDDHRRAELKNISRPCGSTAFGSPRARAPTRATDRSPVSLALPDKPSIAVLPFQNMSGDPEQEYFADGMVEEIITAIARLPWLFVIARNSAFTYKGRAVDVKQVARELGRSLRA